MNVILLVNDTFRRDYLGCYGNDWIATPNLDAFSQRAAIFDQYYIASYPTVPNRWDMAVGRFGFPTRGWEPLHREDITLAQRLARNGVHTQMIWDTPMLDMNDYNYSRGYAGIEFVHGQKNDPWITNPSLPVRFPAQPHKLKSLKSLDGYLRNHFDRRHERQFPVARTMTQALEWLETNHSHPDGFFLYVDMWDPHEPFDCPWYDYELYADPGYVGDQITYPQYGRTTYMTEAEHRNVKALYAGLVTLVDRWVGAFLDMADRLKLFDDTLIIWTTDHGHLFGEHDLQGKPGAQMGRLYEETARIPLLVSHPEEWGAGQHIRGIVQPPDLVPSILEFMGVSSSGTVEGQSFWPLVQGEVTQGHPYAFSNRYPQGGGQTGAAFDGWVGSDRTVEPGTVTSDEWAYICMPAGSPSELYNLHDDPAQEHNLIDQHPEIARHMKEAWITFLEEHGASQARIAPFLDELTDVHAVSSDEVYAFRDDLGQWITFPTERQAREAAYQENAPGPQRTIETITFGQLLADNPRNLVHLFDQYYWAEDLA